LGDNYLAERAVDLFDLEKRVLKQLLGERREELSNLTQPVVVLANNLTPSETASIDTDFVLGFATEAGGRTSHTAILAGALEIPAVVAVGGFLSGVSGGETVIIDGTLGTVIIDPDEQTLKDYLETAARFHTVEVQRESLTQVRAETRDGVHIRLAGNIEFPEEVDHCTHRGAEGIGLYRTEFLYIGRDIPPSEEDHYQAYVRVVNAFRDRPVVIRTLDLGADKVPDSMQGVFEDATNPALGLRSLRISLQNLALFKTQLRAILRAAVLGDVCVMFPLVTSLLELRQARMILGDVMDDLDEHGVPFRRDLRVGMMVEVPSAALMAEEFAPEVDFFSIGTNDLIQYTLAVDRANPAVANLYSSADPSILRLIRMVVQAGAKHIIPVNVCGQMSSDPVYTSLLVGLGLRQLSVTPQAIPEIKQVIRSLSILQAEDIARHAAGFDVAREVEAYLRGELKKLCPDIVV
jgi:phosphotransferase system enzyme I (PtsI)